MRTKNEINVQCSMFSRDNRCSRFQNKLGLKAQCNEVRYKGNYSEMLAYLDNHVREIGGEIWWGGESIGA